VDVLSLDNSASTDSHVRGPIRCAIGSVEGMVDSSSSRHLTGDVLSGRSPLDGLTVMCAQGARDTIANTTIDRRNIQGHHHVIPP